MTEEQRLLGDLCLGFTMLLAEASDAWGAQLAP